jgi:outer membrane protein OmpA-like peptidoglycan-associated protein
MHSSEEKMRRTAAVLALVGILGTGVAGCATKAQTGAAAGAGAGAVLGGLIGKYAGSTVMGALTGAVVGGAAGAVIGGYMDRQAEELENDLENARVERVGEGILITFDSGILFAVDRSELSGQARANLDKLSQTLNKYDDTELIIQGHTDATGTDAYNQQLSEQRAGTVARYLAAQGVSTHRMAVMGMGESNPKADNTTDAGRAQNRRVEVAIVANEELKQQAQREAADRNNR